jgi:photosystem II stability/assembly factor-like uncharacterized protein
MRRTAGALACALAWTAHSCAAQGGDVLDQPARQSAWAAQRLVTSLSSYGGVVLAAGQRGHLLRSADGGASWTQARVPLSSDLTAVQLVDASVGFAAGHDGAVLRSDDGGRSWTRILDGRDVNRLVLEYMRARPAAGAGDRRLLAEAERNAALGPDKPILALHFSNRDDGFVVGAYNLILHTRDGGRRWEPWFDRVDNPKLLNLYAIRPAAGALYIAGEAGLLLRLDEKARRFRALASPYQGSFFGVVASGRGVLAYGMRGHAFLSEDEGRSWVEARTGLQASITDGAYRETDGTLVLVDQAGGVVTSRDGGHRFARVPAEPALPLAAVSVAGQRIVVGGPRGVHTIDFPGIR